jgi:hypothetical protein
LSGKLDPSLTKALCDVKLTAGARAFGKFDEILAKVEKMKKGFTEYVLTEW